MSVTFGIATCSGAITGCYIQDISWGSTCSLAEATDESGNVIQTDAYGKKKNFSANATVNGECSLSAGDKITIAGAEYTVTSAMFKEAVNGYKTFSVSGTAAADVSGGA